MEESAKIDIDVNHTAVRCLILLLSAEVYIDVKQPAAIMALRATKNHRGHIGREKLAAMIIVSAQGNQGFSFCKHPVRHHNTSIQSDNKAAIPVTALSDKQKMIRTFVGNPKQAEALASQCVFDRSNQTCFVRTWLVAGLFGGLGLFVRFRLGILGRRGLRIRPPRGDLGCRRTGTGGNAPQNSVAYDATRNGRHDDHTAHVISCCQNAKLIAPHSRDFDNSEPLGAE